MYTLIFLCCMISASCALKLPEYIKPCKKTDPNLNECALNSARKTFEKILNGDRKYKVYNLNPLIFPEINVDVGDNLQLKCNDLVCTGLDQLKILSVNIDLKRNEFTYKFRVPRLVMTGKYDINGKILILPIVGKGNSNITFVGGDYVYTTKWNVKNVNGNDYIHIEDFKLDLKLTRAHFDFENLFNGDKTLGPEMNRFLNENWDEVMKELGPGIGRTLAAVNNSVFKAFFEIVPFNQIFTD